MFGIGNIIYTNGISHDRLMHSIFYVTVRYSSHRQRYLKKSKHHGRLKRISNKKYPILANVYIMDSPRLSKYKLHCCLQNTNK